MSLVVSVLFIFLLLGKTNSQPKPRNVPSWVILAFKGVIVVILSTLIATLSLLMSASLRIPPSSPLQRILLFQMSYPFLLSFHLPISLLHLQMSCLDHFRFILAILAVLVPLQGLLLNHLLYRSHLLLQFRNRLMIYLLPFEKILVLLLTHILFIIFSSFIIYLYPILPLFPFCLLSLPLKALVRLSLIRARNRQWLRKWMFFPPMAHGSLSLFLLSSLPLVVIGFIQ